MSTQVPVTIHPSVPTPTDEPASLVQSILAIKQNIEIGYPHSTPVGHPTTINTAINAALRAVNNS